MGIWHSDVLRRPFEAGMWTQSQGVLGHSDMGRNGMLGDSWLGWWMREVMSQLLECQLQTSFCLVSWFLSLVLAVVSAEMVTIMWNPTAPTPGSGKWLELLPIVFQKLCGLEGLGRVAAFLTGWQKPAHKAGRATVPLWCWPTGWRFWKENVHSYILFSWCQVLRCHLLRNGTKKWDSLQLLTAFP